jgi:hypothetical protein
MWYVDGTFLMSTNGTVHYDYIREWGLTDKPRDIKVIMKEYAPCVWSGLVWSGRSVGRSVDWVRLVG